MFRNSSHKFPTQTQHCLVMSTAVKGHYMMLLMQLLIEGTIRWHPECPRITGLNLCIIQLHTDINAHPHGVLIFIESSLLHRFFGFDKKDAINTTHSFHMFLISCENNSANKCICACNCSLLVRGSQTLSWVRHLQMSWQGQRHWFGKFFMSKHPCSLYLLNTQVLQKRVLKD